MNTPLIGYSSDGFYCCLLIYLLRFITDGQMIAIRLSKQVHKATAAIKKGVLLFNGIVGMKSSSRLPMNISEKDALAPSSPVFDNVLHDSQVIKLFNVFGLVLAAVSSSIFTLLFA